MTHNSPLTPPTPVAPSPALTVCGGIVTNPQDYPSTTYHGRTLIFCTQACLRAFQTDPEAFLAGEIEHPDS